MSLPRNRRTLPEPGPVTVLARNITARDKLAIYSAKRRQFRYERVHRVMRLGDSIIVTTDRGPALTLTPDQPIQVARPTRAR